MFEKEGVRDRGNGCVIPLSIVLGVSSYSYDVGCSTTGRQKNLFHSAPLPKMRATSLHSHLCISPPPYERITGHPKPIKVAVEVSSKRTNLEAMS